MAEVEVKPKRKGRGGPNPVKRPDDKRGPNMENVRRRFMELVKKGKEAEVENVVVDFESDNEEEMPEIEDLVKKIVKDEVYHKKAKKKVEKVEKEEESDSDSSEDTSEVPTETEDEKPTKIKKKIKREGKRTRKVVDKSMKQVLDKMAALESKINAPPPKIEIVQPEKKVVASQRLLNLIRK